MNCAGAITQEPGIRGVCGLLGAEGITGCDSEGLAFALREIVEHFRIEWELTPYQDPDSAESSEAGFVLELKGTHEPAEHYSGRTCVHCANLMLGLRIVGDWLFPPQGKCSFCEVLACSNFVRGNEHSQQEGCSSRALRLASQRRTACQLGACHIWCMTKTKERLRAIGAVERKGKKHQQGGLDHESKYSERRANTATGS